MSAPRQVGTGRRQPGGRPTHPKLAAALLMIGVVVFLVAVSLAAAVL